MMFSFDTLDKKPKVWNIAILSLITVAVLLVMLSGQTPDLSAIAVIFSLYLLAVIVLLIRAFIRQLRYNPYSYNSIYYAGFALFVLAVLVFQISRINMLQGGDIDAVTKLSSYAFSLLSSAKNYMLLSSPFVLLFSVALCISNVSLIRHEGRSVYNILGIILSLLMIGGIIFLFFHILDQLGKE